MKIVSLVVAAVLAAPVSAFACGDYMGFYTPEQRIEIARTIALRSPKGQGLGGLGGDWRAWSAVRSLTSDPTVDAALRAEAFAIIGARQWNDGKRGDALTSFRSAIELDASVLLVVATRVEDVSEIRKSLKAAKESS